MTEKYYVWLVLALGAAQQEINALLKRFGGAQSAFNAIKSNVAALGAELGERARNVKLSRAERLIEDFAEHGGSVITIENSLYPARLKSIENPPCVLFAKGRAELLTGRLVTAVGSRAMTPESERTILNTVGLLKTDYTLVSTLSSGCDSFSCMAALRAGMPFIEVMPCGHKSEYPRGSATLRSFLLDCGGLTVTELPPSEKPSQPGFLRRSRILGGISPATVIFQAGMESGALRTAEYSDSPLFVPPHDIFRAEYAGAVISVRKGAGLFLGKKDIERAYAAPLKTGKASYRKKHDPGEDKGPEKPEKAAEPAGAKAKKPAEKPKPGDFESEKHFRVYSLIAESEVPLSAQAIMDAAQMESSELEEIMLDLVIGDRIKAVAGNKYIIS